MTVEHGSGRTDREPKTHSRSRPQATEEVAKVGDAYREGAALATSRMSAMLSAYEAMASGLQEIQKTYLEALRRSVEMASAGPRELMGCKNFSDVAEVQRELVCRGLDEWFDSSAKLLAVTSRIAEDAMRPVEEHAHRDAA